MRIRISNDTQRHMGVLKIEKYPFTSDQLRKAFRTQIKIAHSDHGGSDEKAIEIINAYNILKNYVYNSVNPIKETEPKEEELYTTCKKCNGYGQFVHTYNFRLPSGKVKVFQTKRQCDRCYGSGKVKVFNPVLEKNGILI